MPSKISSLALFLATTTTLLHRAVAGTTPFDNEVFYLTNCQTSDTAAVYSEVSRYFDVTKSFAGQNPDKYEDTSLGQVTTWEGAQVTWFYNGADPTQADSFSEFINANAQDPSVPTFSQVGCASFDDGFPGGAIRVLWNCYKDSPRVLYTTADHECTTLYYCRATTDACPFQAPGTAAKLVEQQSQEL